MGQCISKENKRIRPSGLKNNSEVCYMNAMIQTVASSSIFIEQLENLNKNNCVSLSNFIEILKSVNKSLNLSHSLDGVDPLNRNTKLLEELIRSIGWNKPSQQDALDLLATLIKAIHEELKETFKEISMPMKIKLVHRFTGIDFREKVQDHLGLSVGLCGNYSKRPGVCLEYLIKEHFSPTIIDNDPSQTTQMFFYQQTPDVLLIHIQANKWDHERGVMFKPKYYIIYEETMTLTLNVVKRLEEKEEGETVEYNLKGFVIHSGRISRGHYISHRKYEDKWYLVNDEQVKKITFDKNKVPYIMVFEKGN